MNILVLGASGMLGNAVFRVLSESENLTVFGTVRSLRLKDFFIQKQASRLIVIDDLENLDVLERLFAEVKPQVVVNCVALRKTNISDPIKSIKIFSLLPIRLAHLCHKAKARLILMSSDAVFSGSRGLYSEDDIPDATDLYGIVKFLGEVDKPNVITLRTSIIGHELQGKEGLLEWFLSQNLQCGCYTKSIFSGFPTVVLARLIRDVIIPNPNLHGIYHVATQPISKYDLLSLVAKRYSKSINLVPDDKVVVDRSLSANRFTRATGYVPPEWPELINLMYSYQFNMARR